MKLKEVKEILDARVLTQNVSLDMEVFSACGSDLMSDVLAFVKDQAMLLTGLLNPQVVRTAEMMDIKAIVFVRGKEPEQDVVDMADEKDMLLMSTDHPLYIACGKLYQSGLTGNGGSKNDRQ